MRPPRISVITPTYGRHDYHEHLYRQFTGQTYPFKDLWIADDTEAPSLFYAQLRDPRVHYQWSPHRSSIGAKRNQLISQVGGDIVVAFDDDDIYKNQYIATMVGRLGDDALTKLSVWDSKSAYDGSIWRWDTRQAGPINYAVSGSAPPQLLPDSPDDEDALEAALWGYGFSYVFAKDAWKMAPFGDINSGEDLDFVRRLRALVPPDVVTLQNDLPDSVLHTIHARSTSRIYPQECIGWCTPCTRAAAETNMDYAPASPAGSPQQAGRRAVTTIPKKITLVPGVTYDAIALVKNSHKTPEILARAPAYGISVLGVDDNVQPPGVPTAKAGYRYIHVRARAGAKKTVPSRVPFPFSAVDETRIISLAS